MTHDDFEQEDEQESPQPPSGRMSAGTPAPTAGSGPGTATRRGPKYAVETRGLTKIYRGRVRALDEVDLRVPLGSCFGLLGPNGAGKSTLVKTLLGIVHPTAGAATLLGGDIGSPESRRGVGYLPEGHRFPRYLTGRGVLEYLGRLSGMRGEELEQDIEAKLALVGMQDWAATRVTRYSKGMQQRVGLAQAMMGNPALVFLDEPTDGVDPLGRHQMRTVIKGLTLAGTTVFLNSHLLLEVEQICSHVAVMHHGRILRQGNIDEIRRAVREDGALLQVRFTTGKVDPATLQAIARVGEVGEAEEGSFTVSLPDEGETSRVIDILRQGGVSIYSVEPSRINLEEAFIDLISREDDQGLGGDQL